MCVCARCSRRPLRPDAGAGGARTEPSLCHPAVPAAGTADSAYALLRVESHSSRFGLLFLLNVMFIVVNTKFYYYYYFYYLSYYYYLSCFFFFFFNYYNYLRKNYNYLLLLLLLLTLFIFYCIVIIITIIIVMIRNMRLSIDCTVVRYVRSAPCVGGLRGLRCGVCRTQCLPARLSGEWPLQLLYCRIVVFILSLLLFFLLFFSLFSFNYRCNFNTSLTPVWVSLPVIASEL